VEKEKKTITSNSKNKLIFIFSKHWYELTKKSRDDSIFWMKNCYF
jgi:hypothetical protein